MFLTHENLVNFFNFIESYQEILAERVGFEPTVGFLPRALSKGVP